MVKHDQNMQEFWHTKWCLLRQCFYWKKLQHLLSGWCTYCAWSWCARNYWQWSLNTGHPASQGVGCSLVSVHCSKCCRFHCHTGTTLCRDTQRVGPWASAPQPSKTYKGHWTWVSLHVMLKYYGTNFKYYCLFREISVALHIWNLQNGIAQGIKPLLKVKFEAEKRKCRGWGDVLYENYS